MNSFTVVGEFFINIQASAYKFCLSIDYTRKHGSLWGRSSEAHRACVWHWCFFGEFQGPAHFCQDVSLTVQLLLNFALRCFYNLFIHPLRKYPGPSLLAASRLPLSYWTLTGQAPRKVLVLHQKYGDVVRIAPDQLAYANAAGWKDVYGHRPGHATSQLPKDLTAFPPTPPGLAKGIITADDAEHSRFRRLLSHAFSARALEQQEGLILGYIKQLVQGLSEECHRGPQNILAWYNWTTFDLIGDLAFGEPFGCLVRREYHPWIKTILDNIKIGLAMSCIRNYPHLAALMPYLIPKSVAKKRLEHSSMTEAKVERRLEKGVTDKPDGEFK